MYCLGQTFGLSFLRSNDPLKTSSSPPSINIEYHFAKSFNIRCALNDDSITSDSSGTHTRAPFFSTSRRLSDSGLSNPLGNDCSHKISSEPFASAYATLVTVPAPDPVKEMFQGIGILNFLKSKSYFITGGTGLLAKAFIEKVLRVGPSTTKIYLLVKAKDEEEALKRVETEIVECGLFKRLEEIHGESYREFMLSKLIPVMGDLSEPDLGISNVDLVERMTEEVDVIVNSAANTTFDERYDMALNINTKGPTRVLSFAMRCKRLRLFLHVSTAYVNGKRQGVVREKPFYMGQSIAEEMANTSGAQQSFPMPKLDVHGEIKLATEMANVLPAKKMKELGLERARMFGWQDVYVFTKAMGEMMISSNKGDIPITIIRPSIIESTYSEPFPGWIQGNRMLDPLILSYGKGLIPSYFADPEAPVDIVPADMVVNTMVSAMAKHGSRADSELNVYQVASCVVNPLNLRELSGYSCDHFMSSPLKDSGGEEIGIEKMKFLSSLDEFSAFIKGEVEAKMGLGDLEVMSNPKRLRKLQIICKRTVESLINMAKIYEPYGFYKGRFHNGNTQEMIEEMSEDELRIFPVDLRSINWKDYIMNIHIPGLKTHILKLGRSVPE